jgi:hypothetical protein
MHFCLGSCSSLRTKQTAGPQPKFLEAKAAFRIGSLMVPRGGLGILTTIENT